MQLILRCKWVRERTLQSGARSWKISKFNRHLEGELWRPWASTCMNVCEVAQSCPTLCDPIDCSLPHSFVHGIFQARVLERVAISFSRGSSWPRDRIQVSCIAGRHFNLWATREALFRTPFLKKEPCPSDLLLPLFNHHLFPEAILIISHATQDEVRNHWNLYNISDCLCSFSGSILSFSSQSGRFLFLLLMFLWAMRKHTYTHTHTHIHAQSHLA